MTTSRKQEARFYGARWILEAYQSGAIRRAGVSNAGQAALGCLVAHANRRGEAFASLGTVAHETGRSRRNVRKAVAELVESGLISLDSRSTYRANLYRFRGIEGTETTTGEATGEAETEAGRVGSRDPRGGSRDPRVGSIDPGSIDPRGGSIDPTARIQGSYGGDPQIPLTSLRTLQPPPRIPEISGMGARSGGVGSSADRETAAAEIEPRKEEKPKQPDPTTSPDRVIDSLRRAGISSAGAVAKCRQSLIRATRDPGLAVEAVEHLAAEVSTRGGGPGLLVNRIQEEGARVVGEIQARRKTREAEKAQQEAQSQKRLEAAAPIVAAMPDAQAHAHLVRAEVYDSTAGQPLHDLLTPEEARTDPRAVIAIGRDWEERGDITAPAEAAEAGAV